MGDPKKPKKKYETPRFPWRSDVLQSELVLLGQYGLRNKRELWRCKTMVSKFRAMARSLLSMPVEKRAKLEAQLLGKLKRFGFLPETAVLDDVLDMTVENILERRLQTIVFRKGLAKSIYQARQLITHGHIAVNGRKVFSPSYLVEKDEEDSVTYAPTSPLNNPEHPLRLTIEASFTSSGGEEAK
ncbi:30S ribosomal protein S4 [Candidatus Bathyarchaeota archaeon]|nr:30S ribosomal protein S4 [Candidatus Bathyarchaeota archaeon]